MDGVIVNTVDLHYQSWQTTLDLFDIPFSRLFNQRLRGLNRRKSIQRILEENKLKLSKEQQDEIFIHKNKVYLELIERSNQSIIMPGVTDILQDLARHNLPVAVASSSRNAKIILQLLNINHHFVTIIDGTDIQVSKPDPAVFLEAAKYLQSSPQTLVVIEDSPEGIKAAMDGGFVPLGVGTHFVNKAAGVSYIRSLENISVKDMIQFCSEWTLPL